VVRRRGFFWKPRPIEKILSRELMVKTTRPTMRQETAPRPRPAANEPPQAAHFCVDEVLGPTNKPR
jgi:hypothetical protein